MDEAITRVEVQDRGTTEVLITTSQGGGCSIVLKPGMHIRQFTDGKFYLGVDERRIYQQWKSTYVGGPVDKPTKEKIRNLIEKGEFNSVSELTTQAIQDFLQNY